MGNLINTIATVLQILSALGVILLVLLQHGKGADMGAAFGSGASGSLFGATGSANFLSRVTAAMAAVFFVSTLALAFFANDRPRSGGSLMEGIEQPASSVPSLPGAAPSSTPPAPAGSVPPASTVPPAGTTSPAAPSGAGAVPDGGTGAASQIPK
ncbi:MAG TPA: preprotein translocase subunit SecG [Lautropia sp.]|nr:preprotein translocase subunit SecG [Lautropia sp.]